MRIGVPSETKTLEGRVALVPAACADLVRRGHEVFVQQGAGDEERLLRRASTHASASRSMPTARKLYEGGELIVKVKEPIAGDLKLLRKDHLLFCYLHLAPEPKLTKRLLDIGLTGIAFESVEEADGSLPLLAPMSIIAGRIAVQIGTHLLHQPAGGKGKLLGGLPSTERGKVVVLGAGAAGGNSAALAAAGGANVVVFDKRQDRLARDDDSGRQRHRAVSVRGIRRARSARRRPRHRRRADSERQGAACGHARDGQDDGEGQRARRYLDRPGRLLRDLASRRLTKNPTYVVDGVTHFCVTNMPGAVPQTSSEAICAAILPYVQRLASDKHWRKFAPLESGINVEGGKLVHPALKGMAF